MFNFSFKELCLVVYSIIITISFIFYLIFCNSHHINKNNAFQNMPAAIVEDEKPNTIHANETIKTNTTTEVKYVYKEMVPQETIIHNTDTDKDEVVTTYIPEKTDIETNIGKQELNVKVNGHETTFKKHDDEKFVFDKGKFQLDQTSTAEINIKVEPIDNTKHLGVGVGISNNAKPAGIVTVPIDKKHNVDGWCMSDGTTTAGGIMIKF